jgi:hypothetical protein
MLAVKTHVYDVSSFLSVAEDVKSAAMVEVDRVIESAGEWTVR